MTTPTISTSTNTTDAAHVTASGPLTSPRHAALFAGACYLAIFVLAIFANFVAISPVLEGDPATTVARLTESATMVRLATVAFLAITLLDVVAAWALYVLLRPVHRDLALLGAWFRLGYTVLLGAGLACLQVALRGAQTGAIDDAAAHLAVQAFDITWVIGLSLFGVHLVLLALLLGRAAQPRLLSAALSVAGMAYVLDTVARLLLSDYAAYADLFLAMVATPSILGELALTVWLLLIAAGRRHAPTGLTVGASGP